MQFFFFYRKLFPSVQKKLITGRLLLVISGSGCPKNTSENTDITKRGHKSIQLHKAPSLAL